MAMVALRSRRLERLFDARLDEVTYAHIADLVTAAVPEAYDLEYKAELYGKSDREKRDLAGDIAAMANTAGGLLVLGIAEDDQARAAAAPGVALSDEEVRRIHLIAAAQIAPSPTFDVLQIENPQQSGHGFILIAVPRSPMGPHAVLVNEALRFPRRSGTTTIYLSEPEVASAYRARFAGLQSRFDDLTRYEHDLLARLDTSELTYVAVTLVPDLGGDFTIDMRAMRAFQQEMVGRQPLILNGGSLWRRAFVASRRLVADGTMKDDAKSRWLACELHESGAGRLPPQWTSAGPTRRPASSAMRAWSTSCGVACGSSPGTPAIGPPPVGVRPHGRLSGRFPRNFRPGSCMAAFIGSRRCLASTLRPVHPWRWACSTSTTWPRMVRRSSPRPMRSALACFRGSGIPKRCR
jgi:hypothetical protein